jgi:hypothetical protein
LLRYWSQLQTWTKQTIDFLQAAAEGCCAIDSLGKKNRKKRKKALEVMEELMSRMQDNACLYGPLADILRERAEMRRQWKKREEDHVFYELDRSQRPLAVPFHFHVEGGGKREVAVSPMPGLPDELVVVADRIDAWGRAYASGNPLDLPTLPQTCIVDAQTAVGEKRSISTVPYDLPNEHCVSLSWKGWGNRDFGLKMQSPWAGLLLEGKKREHTICLLRYWEGRSKYCNPSQTAPRARLGTQCPSVQLSLMLRELVGAHLLKSFGTKTNKRLKPMKLLTCLRETVGLAGRKG